MAEPLEQLLEECPVIFYVCYVQTVRATLLCDALSNSNAPEHKTIRPSDLFERIK